MKITQPPWHIGEPGGPGGNTYSLVNQQGRIVAYGVPNEADARFMARIAAMYAAAQLSIGDYSPAKMAAWLTELADWLAEHDERIFACDCDAYQESDTGAWVHDENRCASIWGPHADVVLRESARLLAAMEEAKNER